MRGSRMKVYEAVAKTLSQLGVDTAFGLVGSLLLVLTPTETFDVVIPWLLLFAFAVMAFGRRAADWLHARVTIGRPTLIVRRRCSASMTAISAAASA